MGRKYSKEYEIYYYNVDSKLNCTMPIVLGILSDVGNKDSEDLGSGVNELLSKNMTWIFYNYDVKVKRYPKYGEKINVITQSIGFKKFYAVRNYEIIGEDGERIVEGSATFLMLDIKKRRAMRIPKEQYAIYGEAGDMEGEFKLPRLSDFKEYDYEEIFKVRYSDIDSNGHVNNTKYIEWAIETLPKNIIDNYMLEEIKVIFEKECRYGEEVKVLTKITNNEDGTLTTQHKVLNSEGKELTKLEGKMKETYNKYR
ncbi:acyl-[acyl-carrier-protein] thioesterase [Caproiciproducens sp. MSJ-32]|uniref:acyl-[acyl-carrier-protein] thioesterase n=1 Tax=Caproiciproducens sp. MSJ-32 TaxID=2841527 RepID=UPI001C10BB49|nr:acyl-ACP thioesterase domain-containing protein [Caproiciproducens sp. MSJ-32]MBU5454291.1 acyl-[acyl-carrier-protein] thioesterase [Caproiciproducens sp. MSJ-32]